MAHARYEVLGEKDEEEDERTCTTRPIASNKERRERFLKTVFAACVFSLVCVGGLLTVSLDLVDHTEHALWYARRELISEGNHPVR